MLRTLSAACRVIPSIIRPLQINLNVGIPKPFDYLKYQCFGFKTSSRHNDVMEFFDEKSNWGEQTVKVGRAWNVEELRIKSNSDLHKLWYILLKERNMLLTMEHECKESVKLFPNPERIDKVKISMSNVEQVVRERNRAYHLLETGETGERKVNLITNELGLRRHVTEEEHLLPRYMSRSKFRRPTTASKKFVGLYIEQFRKNKEKENNRNRGHVLGLLKRFPNIDKEELQRRYPDLKVNRLVNSRKAEGHFVKKL